MNTQKYHRGNLVEVLFGHPVWSSKGGKTTTEDMSPEEVGQKAIIQYSYADEYGGSNVKDYSIMFMETGSTVAWKTENQLKFIDKGGEHLFEEAKQNGEKQREKNKEKGIYTMQDYARLIAWLINCDNKRVEFTDKAYTTENIINSNSHGELHGIYSAVEFVSKVMEDKKLLKVPFKNKCNEILKDKSVEISVKYASGIGMRCIRMLYQTPPEFDAAIEHYF